MIGICQKWRYKNERKLRDYSLHLSMEDRDKAYHNWITVNGSNSVPLGKPYEFELTEELKTRLENHYCKYGECFTDKKPPKKIKKPDENKILLDMLSSML